MDKFGATYLEAFTYNLQEVLRTVGTDEIKEIYLRAYDELANIEESEAGSSIKGRDPMSLKNLRSIFEKQISKELSESKVVGGQWQVSLMNKDLLGYSGAEKTGPPTTVDVLAFYLEGVPDEHAFITVEQYKKGRKSGSRGDYTGRLGAGFLMTKEAYINEAWEAITGLSFAQVRHPISSQKRYTGFDDINEKINFSKYITLALDVTNATFNK